MSAYDDYLNGLQQEDTKRERLTTSLGEAATVNPDEFASQVKLAKAAAISIDALPQFKAEAQQAKLFGEIGMDRLWKDAPKTSDFLSHPDHAKLSSDDVANLSGFEQAAKTLKNYGGAFGEGVVGQGIGTLFTGAGKLYDITSRQLAKPIIAIGGESARNILEAPIPPYLDPSRLLFKNPGESLKAFGKYMAPAGKERTFGTDVAGGLGQLTAQALVQYLTGGTVSSLSLLAQGTDIVGEKVAKDNASQDAKDSAMLGGGLITSVTEKYALDKILGPAAAPVKNAIAASLARIGVAATAEGGQEIAENIGHDALRKLLTNQEAKIDLPGSAYEGAVGFTVGGIARSIIEAALHVRVRGVQREQEAQQAGQMNEMLGRMNQYADASNLRLRDSETAQGFFQSILDEGRDAVYISPEALAQSGLAEQMAQAIPAVAEQLQSAAESGHDIRIPIADLMATMAGPELEQSLLPHVAVEPGGFTPTTAQEYMQSDKAAELQAEMDRVLGDQQVDDTFKASADAVKNSIFSELTATTRWDKSKNEADATIYSAYYAVRAAQMGMTPEALYAQRRVNFSDVLIGGQQFDQGGTLRSVDLSGNGNRVDHFDDKKGLMYSAQRFPAGTRWTVFETFTADEGGNQVLGETFKYKSLDEAQAAVRGLRVSATQKAKNSAKYGAIPNLWKGEEKKVAKALIDAGIGIERFSSSTQSRSKYIYLDSGLKVRLADHALPAGYDQPDIDYRYGGDAIVLVDEVRKAEEGAPTPDSAATQLPVALDQSATGNRGTFDPADANILNQFAGPAAATADAHALSSAQSRLATGEDAEKVRQDTGWFKGADEKWRYEISDADAKLKKPYPENGALWVDVWKSRLMAGEYSTVGTMLDHSALFAAYPALADIAVSAKRGAGASYSVQERRIDIGEDVPMYEVVSVLLHEIQHGIQRIEGFATGGSYDSARKIIHDVAKKQDEYWGSPEVRAWVEEQERIIDDMDGTALEAALQEHAKKRPESNLPSIDLAEMPADVYRRLAGEAEARNVQSRQNLTEEQRRAQSPESTQDVASRDVIVVLNGNVMDSAPTPSNATPLVSIGKFSPEKLTVILLKGANLSTTLHEGAHFFFENDIYLASKILADANIHGYDTLTVGEKQILDDVSALMNWNGIEGDITTQLRQWEGMDFEEKRTHHERTAESFEHYLFRGKAPSIELHPYFQRFSAWWKKVYTSIKDFLAKNPEAGKLNPEVSAVFDRMLATTEEIKLAEYGRSMMPLFRTQAEAEQVGMTPGEFASYQHQGIDATNEAVQDLQARGLRDMQWIHNARGRIIKQMQKESAAKRAEVQMAVRAEVMSQPIYRAWQFLTGKVTADDKIEPHKVTRSDPPGVLDETLDSLFVAIAKLGGINKDEVVKTWGVDPADKPASGLFGKPLWRVEGGLSIDGMAEALSQYGYLEKDEHGKWDIRELEDKFKAELGGDQQFSVAYDYAGNQQMRAGDQVANPMGLSAGRLDRASLTEIGLPAEIIQTLKAHRMTAQDGIHPDIVAEMFGFSSGDELTRRLAAAESPKAEIEALTDQRMLEQFGDLSSEESIKKAADKAIHNDVRARMVATELAALEKATGKRSTLASAAKEYAAALISRLKVRDIKPGQYAAGEVRAGKAAEKASKSGDITTAAAEKRNQLINTYATRAAYDAQDEVDKGLRYLKTFDNAGKRKGLDADYTDQIDALLERFDLRKGQSGKAIDKRKALAEWITSQQDAGLEPDIPQQLVNEAFRKSYKDMTVEELRGLIDTIRQIEHLGRLKHKLLTARDQRAYEAVRDEIATSIELHAGKRTAETRTPDTVLGKSLQKMRNFWAAHIKSAMWARIMDGGQDGGPMWEYFVRAANERGDQETTMRAEATARLSEILDPVFKLGKMQAKVFFPGINRSLTREARIAIALNVGNASNLQRLQGGEGWTDTQLAEILRTLTVAEWQAVQAVWDHFESYRPQIAAKERRVYGKEPEWIAPTPFTVQSADGQSVAMRGGYYPVKYDPAASQRAEEHSDAEGAKRQLQGAYTTATTRRSFTKTRAEEVNGRPLLYSLAGVYSGVNDVIHDLAWHEWLIDTNRLLRSQTIDNAIRSHYGPEVKQQFKKWSADIAEGDKASTDAGDIAVNYLRQSVSVAGLGFNVMSAAIQPLGITQSIVRVGAKWVGRGVAKYVAHPIELTREVNSMSSFMENRARTRFRELNELRNQVEGQTAVKEFVGHYAYFLMMRFQQAVDVPTWWGAYEKAVAEGNDDVRAVSLADQAVIDAQGGGMLKDQSGIERTGATGKLFTVFYSFMNTAMNMGVAQTMTERNKAKLVADYALLYVIPPMLGMALKAALTPGDSGDDDMEKIAKKLLAAQIDYMMGMMVYVREFSDVAKTLTGANDMGRDYQGPAGLRIVVDGGKFAKQVSQGEFDDAFRKASVNLIGDLFGLPSAQINRTITGTKALVEGETSNPAAIAFGFQKPH